MKAGSEYYNVTNQLSTLAKMIKSPDDWIMESKTGEEF